MAFPTFQAAGASVESVSAAVSPAWPTHQANDIGFLLVESAGWFPRLTVLAGFQELACSPQKEGSHAATSATYFALYWKRATGAAEGAPTVEFLADHIRAKIITFRGCSATGKPFTDIEGSAIPDNVTITWPGVTTVGADALIALFSTASTDSSSPQGSGYANANLANITERVDDFSSIGAGSGFIVVTGEKAAAGATGNSTGTLAGASRQGVMTVALTAVAQPADTTPYFKGLGAPAESATVDVTPVWPPHEAGDVALLLVESNNWPITLQTANGFVEAASSPQQSGVNANAEASALAVFWKRATGGAEANPVVNWIADHISARIITFGGCIAAGDPWNVSAGDVADPATTAVSIPGATTAQPNTLIAGMIGWGRQAGAPDFDIIGTWANADLRNLVEKFERNNLVGSGTALALVTGRKPTAGLFGASTGTMSSSQRQARIMLALRGPSGGSIQLEVGVFTLNGQSILMTRSRRIDLGQGVFALAGQNINMTIMITWLLSLEPGTFLTEGFPIQMTKISRGWKHQGSKQTLWTKQPPLELD